eukprot:gene15651-19128_t
MPRRQPEAKARAGSWNSRFLLAGATALAIVGTAGPSYAGREMILDFSWIGLPLCGAKGISPEFVVDSVPAEAKSLLFTLLDPDGKALTSSLLPMPERGIIPKGAISFQPPCRAGVYSWKVDAQDAGGKPLATAILARPFY